MATATSIIWYRRIEVSEPVATSGMLGVERVSRPCRDRCLREVGFVEIAGTTDSQSVGLRHTTGSRCKAVYLAGVPGGVPKVDSASDRGRRSEAAA